MCAVHCRALVLILIMVPIICTRCCRVRIWNLNISSIWFLLSNFSGWFFFLFDWYICWCDEKKSYISQRNVFSFSFFDVQCNMMLFTYITSSLFSFSHRSKFFFTSLTFAFQMRTIHVFLKDSFAKWSVIVMILWHPYFHPTNAQRECA